MWYLLFDSLLSSNDHHLVTSLRSHCDCCLMTTNHCNEVNLWFSSDRYLESPLRNYHESCILVNYQRTSQSSDMVTLRRPTFGVSTVMSLSALLCDPSSDDFLFLSRRNSSQKNYHGDFTVEYPDDVSYESHNVNSLYIYSPGDSSQNSINGDFSVEWPNDGHLRVIMRRM